jgi:hypothetical protein
MLTEKEKVEEELKFLSESYELGVITKEEFDDAKQRLDNKLNEAMELDKKPEKKAKIKKVKDDADNSEVKETGSMQEKPELQIEKKPEGLGASEEYKSKTPETLIDDAPEKGLKSEIKKEHRGELLEVKDEIEKEGHQVQEKDIVEGQGEFGKGPEETKEKSEVKKEVPLADEVREAKKESSQELSREEIKAVEAQQPEGEFKEEPEPELKVEKRGYTPYASEGVKRSNVKVYAYIAVFFILAVGSWYLFSAGNENGDVEPAIGIENVLGSAVNKPNFIVCNSDKECIKEGKIGICNNPGTKNAECGYIDDATVKLTVLTSDDCFNCDTGRILSILKTFYPNLDIETVNYPDGEGKAIVEKFGIGSLPAYILDSEFRNALNYNKLSNAFNEIDGSFVMKNTVANSNYYVGRKEVLNKLDLITEPGQPAGLQAEENIKEFLSAFDGKVDFETHDANGGISKELGINTFPAFLINNKIKLSGVQSADTVKKNFCLVNELEECNEVLGKSLI